MFSSQIQKAVLVGAIGFYLCLVVLGNALDPAANFSYVQHVLSMDTVHPHSTQKWRAITNPELWRLGFVLILVYQTVGAGWLVWAAVRLARARRADWAAAREFASGALVVTMLLWLVPFITLGGEWFQMWQSREWNGIDAASQNFLVHGVVLLYLQTPNPEG
jgi:predicted small integral membrane protein